MFCQCLLQFLPIHRAWHRYGSPYKSTIYPVSHRRVDRNLHPGSNRKKSEIKQVMNISTQEERVRHRMSTTVSDGKDVSCLQHPFFGGPGYRASPAVRLQDASTKLRLAEPLEHFALGEFDGPSFRYPPRAVIQKPSLQHLNS